MDDEIEEYRQKDHSDLDFVYDEETSDQKNREQGEKKEDPKNKTRYWLGVVSVVLMVGLLCAVLLYAVKRGQFFLEDRETSAAPETAETTEGEAAVKADYWKQMETYIRILYPEAAVSRITSNGQYAASDYLMIDMDEDGIYPETAALVWNEEKQDYELDTYYYDRKNDNNICKKVYDFRDLKAAQGEIRMVTVNYNSTDGCTDVILDKRTEDGTDYSIFLRYQKNNWECFGEVSGSLELQQVMGNEEVQSVYDVEGRYLISNPYSGISGARASQYWTVKDDTLWSDYQISYNQSYWDLLYTSEWYMRRPVLAYDENAFSPDETNFKLLQGASLKIDGVYMCDGEAYYHAVTDTGEKGFILLNHIEKGTSCQVLLQSLPFEEVFSETALSDEEMRADAFEPYLPVIDAPFETVLQPGEQYEAWTDLNGDGVYEKIKAESKQQQGQMVVKMYVNDADILYTTTSDQNVKLIIMDFDPSDQWMELGYGLEMKKQFEMFRYDGVSARSLGLSEAIYFNGTPQWEELTLDEAGRTAQLPVYGSINGKDIRYALSVDVKTGDITENDETEYSLDTPVRCTVYDDTVLYKTMDQQGPVVVNPDTPLQLISIIACSTEDGEQEYYGCFVLDDGTSVYSEAVDDCYNLNMTFSLTDLFGGLAG
jgi:hypothetical protein